MALGNYAQQPGLSSVVTVNGETHQINGVVSGSVVAGGLYIAINEQNQVGQPAGTAQVPVSLQDVTLTLSVLPAGVTAIRVVSNGSELGQYTVTDGRVEIMLSAAQWTQWFGPKHYAVVCEAVGTGTLKETMVAISGRLANGETVVLGRGFDSGGGTCPACPTCPTGPSCDLLNDAVAGNFTDNLDGTVTDSRTGLMWLKDAGCLGFGDWDAGAAAGSVQEIITQLNGGTDFSCQDYTDGTYTDWRLPTVQEFVSLMQYSVAGWGMPASHPFVDIGAWYWTANDAPGGLAWYVTLNNGNVSLDLESHAYAAWAVR